MRTRTKICGITQVDCLRLAIAGGADAVGFNLYPKSPRYLATEDAKLLVAEVPAVVSSVGLFVNEQADVVAEKISQINFDLLQFHGDEDNEYCRQFGKPFIKVLRIKTLEDTKRGGEYPDAKGLLFDAHVDGIFGGTGQRIGAELLKQLPANVILAGGLDADNVEAVVSEFRPFAVDVSSGIERSPGIKDPDLLSKFFQAVATADRRNL